MTPHSHLLLRALVDELARCGMRQACTAPGSRNTPILMALARESRLQLFSHIDERCAGFYALGAAKAGGRPVAVTCTSGTAAANLAPAVIEAHQSGVPLIVLTADRPPELREVGAGQAIDQLKLYGDAAKWFFEVDVADAAPERLRWIRTLACRAYWTAAGGRPGPVHLNFPLREPLVAPESLDEDPTGRADGRPYVVARAAVVATESSEDPPPSGRLVIVAGAGTPDPAGLAAFAGEAGIPLLADPLSGARRGQGAIAHYDLVLRDPAFAAAGRPDFILRVGELPTSKPLRAWLAGLPDVAQIAFDPHGAWQDPDAVVGMRIAGELPRPEHVEVEPGWLAAWRSADALAAEAIGAELGESELSEPLVAAALGRLLPAEATLFVAASMPIRDVEAFVGVRDDPPRVLANRGANGIDGTVSSAYGAAAVSPGPVVLLIGDVAMAHDLGGLMTGRRGGPPLTIVLLDNDGGGIFHFLPVAGTGDAFERHVATPHGLDFAHAAALFGCRFETAATLEHLSRALDASLRSTGTTIIAVRTERGANRELHRRLEDGVRGRLADTTNVQALIRTP